jgi:hypothetical protein
LAYPKKSVTPPFKSLAAAGALLLLVANSRAQSHSIGWFTIDGGGGQSTGGAYSVIGTIGQADAGQMSGGQFRLAGGFWSLVAGAPTPGLALPTCVQVDLDPTGQRFALAWGANIGPIPSGESTNPPVTAGYHDIGVNCIRTHDYYGPLDMKVMYPDQGANPALPESYSFTTSDGVWQAILTNGFCPYFRLGNSYTNLGPYAPTNQPNWIEAAVQVIKHYTNAALWGTNVLRYVEIWNEPDNADFWEQGPDSRRKFFAFFTAVAQRLRTEFPDLKIGGPGVTPAAFLAPANTNYIPQFLEHLRSNRVALDFLSWHVYSNEPSNYVQAARFYRACLDSCDFTNTEQHVTEYNSDNRANNDVSLRAWLPGAAINTAAWIAMQQENVALATIYRGPDPALSAPFFYGIFYADAQPKAVALSSKLCNTLAGYSERLRVTFDSTNLWAIAGQRSNEVAVLISNPTTNSVAWDLSLSGGRVPQSPRLTDIVATSTNTTYPNVIYWTLRTNDLAVGSQTIGPWGVQFVTFGILSDYDHWAQTLYGLFGANAAPTADPDGDGFPNESEFMAGTNPTNALSRLYIVSAQAVSNSLALQWPAITGRVYRVQVVPSLVPPNDWRDLSEDLTSGLFTHTNALGPEQYYRVKVVPAASH